MCNFGTLTVSVISADDSEVNDEEELVGDTVVGGCGFSTDLMVIFGIASGFIVTFGEFGAVGEAPGGILITVLIGSRCSKLILSGSTLRISGEYVRADVEG